MRIIYIMLLPSVLFVSCSNDNATDRNLDTHQELFYATADSLNHYKDVAIFNDILSTDTTINDYTKLDYETYRKKYSLDHYEMDQLASKLKVTCEIAKTFKAVEDNMQRAEEIVIQKPHESNNTDYSFNKIIPIDTTERTNEDGFIIEVMEASEHYNDSLK